MTNRIRRAIARPYAAAILLLCALAALPGNAAEIPAVPVPAASGTAAASQDALPELPHVLHPDAPLYPDYYAAALAHTSLTDDPAYRPLRLQAGAVPAEPTLIVLPVQTQAFGFSPTFRALLGARLDQELQRRHIAATRQTDIVDWRGPFVRRLDEATIATFAGEHPAATLLTLYLGHDGSGHAFITLGKQKDGKTTLAHRRVDIPQDEIPTLDLFTRTLLPMLAELGLGDAKAAAPIAPHGTGGCGVDAWQLADISSDAPPDITACHALLMGTLMPDFLSIVANLTQPSVPDRAAWLARTWVEAQALSASSPAMKDVARLAAFQLRLNMQEAASGKVDSQASAVSIAALQARFADERKVALVLTESLDPVVQALARMLTARERASATPVRSIRDAEDEYLQRSTQGLPPFARAVVTERARFTDGFHQVDLCPMVLALPHFKIPAGCEDIAGDTPRTSITITPGETKLLDEWRLAAACKDIYYEGEIQGSRSGLAQVLASMPAPLATHPLVREMRYGVRRVTETQIGLDAFLAQLRARDSDYLKAVATLQRDDTVIRHNRVGDGKNSAALNDQELARLADDEHRLASVLELDLWTTTSVRSELKTVPATFLVDGKFDEARARLLMRANRQPAADASSTSRVPMPQPDEPTRAWFQPVGAGALPTRDVLEKALDSNPSDITLRTALAVVTLEEGATIVEARKIIESRARRSRDEDAIGESNDWCSAADVFFRAGEPAVARDYYARAQAAGTGNEQQMVAQQRLRQLAGDMRGALAVAHARSHRYGGEGAARDEAAFLFMLRRRDEGWGVVLPRLQTAKGFALWQAALTGLRIDTVPLAKIPGWIDENRVSLDNYGGMLRADSWVHTYAVLDRLPSDADVSLLLPVPKPSTLAPWIGGALTMQAAIAGGSLERKPNFVADTMLTSGSDRWTFKPFYAWALWNSTQGRDASLAELGRAPVGSPFASVLATAMIQAAQGQRDQALKALTAARFELARAGLEDPMENWRDDYDTAPYDFVLASWLMTRKTADRAYADQGLRIAIAYQSVRPWDAWPYAAEALLGANTPSRQIAACRAVFLDPNSMFLRESGLRPDPNSAVCRKATAW